MTARSYGARILGKSESIKTEVRCIWILTGNNVSMSNELVRRLIMIDLDAKMANPKDRDEWRHHDLFQWIKRHRGDLVWAALTLIRNWVAQGKRDGKVKPLASFEEWTRAMGGVLEAADIKGFLENRDELQDRAASIANDAHQTAMEVWVTAAKQAAKEAEPAEQGSERRPRKGVETPEAEKVSLEGMSASALADLWSREKVPLPGRLRSRFGSGDEYEASKVGAWIAERQKATFDIDGSEYTLEKGQRTNRGPVWQLVKRSQ